MAEPERRGTMRKPLPMGVYLVVDGVRHPGTLRDLSTRGAGFNDPVLAVRLSLTSGSQVELEVPPDVDGGTVLRLPGEVAHVSTGLRPRLGIRFASLDDATAAELVQRMARQAGAEMTPARGPAGSSAAPPRDLRFVLVEPRARPERGRTAAVIVSLGAAVVIGLLLILVILNHFG